MADSAAPLPLDGITVVALEQAVAAPFATRQLADLGARVIKIERPGSGDFARGYDRTVNGLSSHFVWLNRSKQSLTLDVKHPLAAQVLHRLLMEADVFVQNLAPGATDRLGLDGATLTARNPALIVCNISGYGASGPYRDKKAYDLLIQCETGLVSVTGSADEPSKTGISTADIAGGMYAYSGILTALLQRQARGGGTVLDISLFDALGEWMNFPAYYAAYGGSAPKRSGASHAAIAPYGPFRTGDGKTVNLGIQNEREWARFCTEVLEQPELGDDSRFASNADRVTHRDALTTSINAVFSELTSEQIIARLDAAQIANASMNSMQEFWDHPQHAARDRWREVDSPAGPIKALKPPVIMPNFEPRMDPIPGLGEHTEAVLSDLGFDQAEIDEFRSSGMI